MFDYTNLHEVFPPGLSNPYDRNFQHAIETHRKSFDGVLFIDRVLRAVGISKGTDQHSLLSAAPYTDSLQQRSTRPRPTMR